MKTQLHRKHPLKHEAMCVENLIFRHGTTSQFFGSLLSVWKPIHFVQALQTSCVL